MLEEWENADWVFVPILLEQFMETGNKGLPIKDIFASASKYPCLSRYRHIVLDEETYNSKGFSIIKPEPDCKRMYDFFEKTGTPSYLERIPGFELPSEPILVASETYKTLSEQLEITDREEINKLVWGDQTPRTYNLWKVTEFKNNCTPEELVELTEQSEEMMEIYDRISWYMPMAFLIITTLFELYLLFARKR